MKLKCDIGRFQVTGVMAKPHGMWQVDFQIHTIEGHSLLPFKPKLKAGDFITCYTELEQDALPR
jgi:hypothetical protein